MLWKLGSLDAGPAAMRYTEARLLMRQLAMFAEAEEDTLILGLITWSNSSNHLSSSAYPNLLSEWRLRHCRG